VTSEGLLAMAHPCEPPLTGTMAARDHGSAMFTFVLS
jgi:hypothetical protein